MHCPTLIARICYWIALLSAINAVLAIDESQEGPEDLQAQDRLESALSPLERALGYLERNRDSVNLDGAIGVRIVEGQFSGLLARYWTELPLWLATRLKAVQLMASLLADSLVKSVRLRTPKYYANAGTQIGSHQWDTFYPRRSGASISDPEQAGTGEADGFDEKFSDDCNKAFSGSADGKPGCSIPEACWRVFVASEGRHGYYLTHQLFYLMSGIQQNCLLNLTARAQQTLASSGSSFGGRSSTQRHALLTLMDRKCSSIFAEALSLEKLNFPLQRRDLFMEQIALCGTAGYTEIAQWRWLSRISGWQRAGTGCYGTFAEELPAHLRQPGGESPRGAYGHERRRRAEQVMDSNGCLSHRTSVALGALVTFVRRAIEEGFVGVAAQQ